MTTWCIDVYRSCYPCASAGCISGQYMCNKSRNYLSQGQLCLPRYNYTYRNETWCMQTQGQGRSVQSSERMTIDTNIIFIRIPVFWNYTKLWKKLFVQFCLCWTCMLYIVQLSTQLKPTQLNPIEWRLIMIFGLFHHPPPPHSNF